MSTNTCIKRPKEDEKKNDFKYAIEKMPEIKLITIFIETKVTYCISFFSKPLFVCKKKLNK